jgi:hypothetical protein
MVVMAAEGGGHPGVDLPQKVLIQRLGIETFCSHDRLDEGGRIWRSRSEKSVPPLRCQTKAER